VTLQEEEDEELAEANDSPMEGENKLLSVVN
jgi:hypothetical protein